MDFPLSLQVEQLKFVLTLIDDVQKVSAMLAASPEQLSSWQEGAAIGRENFERLAGISFIGGLLLDHHRDLGQVRRWLFTGNYYAMGSVPAELLGKGRVLPVIEAFYYDLRSTYD